MKIALHGYFDFYGSMAVWIRDCLTVLGHEVLCFDRRERFDCYYDLYFAVDCSEDFSANIPTTDRTKVFWSMDAHMPMGLDRSLNMGRKCDYVFSSNKEYGVQLLKANGLESILIPITYSDVLVKENPLPLKDRKYDVVMIGNMNSPERSRLWSILNSRFNSFTGKADFQTEYVDAMANAKIVVNQPTEPWNIILNNRFFEAMGFGAVLLQKKLKTTLIKDLGFEAGKDFIEWTDLNEVADKIQTILDGEYQEMAYIGCSKVQKYSLCNQLSKIIDIVNDN